MIGLPHIVGKFSYREQPGKWRFVLTDDLRIHFPYDFWGYYAFADDRGRIWTYVDGRDWVILKDYAWDGCSPKFFFGGRHWGTPDFESTRIASCWHDSAGQFRHLPCIKDELPGSKWNTRFKELIKSQGAPGVAFTYHAGLAIGNPFYQAIGNLLGSKRSGRCMKLAETNIYPK